MNDPYARGAYVTLAPGSSLEDCAALAEPEGARLHFAGEATTPFHPGTVHGALSTGRRAAREVLEAVDAARVGTDET